MSAATAGAEMLQCRPMSGNKQAGPRSLPLVHADAAEALPQLVPSPVCLSCHVCCRFPAADSFLRPHFTAEEIRQALAQGLDPAHFSDPNGCQISVVPSPDGEGYLCPAFDAKTAQCRIYRSRPLDCQIYPLAVMWSADGRDVVLGYDAKCPFVAPGVGRGGRQALGVRREGLGAPDASSLSEYAEKIAALIESDEQLQKLAHDPNLIGRYQDDVVALRPLPRLTERVKLLPRARLQPVTMADRIMIEARLAETRTVAELSCYAFAPHVVWQSAFSYAWAELAGHLCLFAENADGVFMSLPPLGPGPMAEALSQAFHLMQHRNGGAGVTRIEGISEELKPHLESLGYQLKPKDPDYLYRAADLVSLAGDRYKSQRAACNHFVRSQRFRVEPYRPPYRDLCLALFKRWALQQESRAELDTVARQMLRDAAGAHEIGLSQAEALGLRGLVVFVEETLCAYTFGYPLPGPCERDSSIFCVLFEIADRSIPGLAQFIFREFCREAVRSAHVWINTMDDSGLQSLQRSKRAYHPARLVPQYIATLK